MTDEELRRRFAELKKRDEGRTPDFRKMWNAPRPVRSRWQVVVPATSIAAAAMFVMWIGARTALSEAEAPRAVAPSLVTTEDVAADEALTFDPAPLDFLLDTPGSAPRAARTSGLDSNPLEGW
jgi:hypothetical protein